MPSVWDCFLRVFESIRLKMVVLVSMEGAALVYPGTNLKLKKLSGDGQRVFVKKRAYFQPRTPGWKSWMRPWNLSAVEVAHECDCRICRVLVLPGNRYSKRDCKLITSSTDSFDPRQIQLFAKD